MNTRKNQSDSSETSVLETVQSDETVQLDGLKPSSIPYSGAAQASNFQVKGSEGTASEGAVEGVSNSQPLSVTDALVDLLENLGVKSAYGVAGGAIASLWASLSNSQKIQVLHCRHEAGAAFAAAEDHFVSNLPVVVFTTAGPGITNAITGLFAARGDGAKVILLSACTSASQRGRWAIQETSDESLPRTGLFTAGAIFNYATAIESAEQLPQIARRLQLGLAQPGSFIAHISIPTSLQSVAMQSALPHLEPAQLQLTTQPEIIAQAAQILSEGTFAIWLGFGARHAAPAILQLAERTGAAVMCSPRAKGIFPEDHPQFVGVTGLGGHESVLTYMRQQQPLHTLVLGTRLGEPTSFWSGDMLPLKGFIQVDIDPASIGTAYPNAKTFPVQSDVNEFVNALLEYFPSSPERVQSLPNPDLVMPIPNGQDYQGLVRPAALMAALQEVIVEGSDAVVLAESGNSFTWATHLLKFSQAGRYRVSTGVGAMGHTATGVVGAAQARSGKAIAIVGDGAMLMNNEISTAVKYQVPAVWIVLNDARYGMCSQGMATLGLKGADATIPQTDFVAIAHGMGADGIAVLNEAGLKSALEAALAATGPYIVDVQVDPECAAPSKGRNQGLIKLGVQSHAGSTKPISFPVV